MCARACVCVPYRELSLSVCLSLRGDDEETKTRVLYLIEKVFIFFRYAKLCLKNKQKNTEAKKLGF